ncbi:hypothetical protein OCF84_21460 (plasmid) [Shewanella xiamenensis]|uniref:Uncharacterized protein n=1 Tax=Shewanella xiamenensis TaxID=332186 RepID=A0ABT6UFP3_9GAMM|nr:hypothetical protein [Shewanella xiamenensis]MDI5832555.1 hypothetical protein [Shewanella xiamenensis]WHF57827.1 hypothetical protein OCF84_21460 [Shewanella xiamenensis]
MTDIELNLLKKLSFLGVEFTVKIPNNIGVEIHNATTADLTLFLENPKALYAQHFGLSLSEYNQCVADEYNVYCSAITKRGYQCKGIVRGGHCTSPDNWKRLSGQYCPIHEGEHL